MLFLIIDKTKKYNFHFFLNFIAIKSKFLQIKVNFLVEIKNDGNSELFYFSLYAIVDGGSKGFGTRAGQHFYTLTLLS